MQHLTEETVAIQGLFKSLIIRGKRDVSIRGICIHVVLFEILFDYYVASKNGHLDHLLMELKCTCSIC